MKIQGLMASLLKESGFINPTIVLNFVCVSCKIHLQSVDFVLKFIRIYDDSKFVWNLFLFLLVLVFKILILFPYTKLYNLNEKLAKRLLFF